MATTTPTPLDESVTSAPGAEGPRERPGRFATRHGALTWAAVLAAIAAAVALAVVTLTGGDDTTPVTGVHSGLAEHGSVRESSERAVNPNGPGAPATEHSANWVTDADQAVNPNGPGAPASEHSADGAS